jgi:hypothetical protein
VGFSKVPPSLLLILLIFDASYPNIFVPPLLIPLETAHKAASPEGALFYDGWLSSSLETSSGAGASSGSVAWEEEEGETALEEMEMEMEMQSCHGTHHRRLKHHHRPVHSDDHHGMEELDSGWETYEYKNIIRR